MKGRLVSLIGMDGAGKSTLVTRLQKELSKQGHKTCIIYAGRGRGNILPIQFFGRFYRAAGGKESNVPVKGTNFNKISLLYTISTPIFALDLFLRYIFNIHPALGKFEYVITDRYSTDLLLMNKVPWKLKRFLYSLLPKPDKIFYVYNKIEILHKRKPEHSVEDLRRQEKIFKKIVSITNAKMIKNDRLESSLKKIMGSL